MKTAAAMGNWWLAASSRQCTYSCITSHAELFGETSNHPGDSGLLQPRFGTLRLVAVPKTKITFEREEISDCRWDSVKYDGAADGDSNKGFCSVLNCVRSQGPSFEGDGGVIVLCTMFLVSSSINVFFIVCGWILSGQILYDYFPSRFQGSPPTLPHPFFMVAFLYP